MFFRPFETAQECEPRGAGHRFPEVNILPDNCPFSRPADT